MRTARLIKNAAIRWYDEDRSIESEIALVEAIKLAKDTDPNALRNARRRRRYREQHDGDLTEGGDTPA